MSSNFLEEANVTTGWTASPTTRGTFDIFTSCLFTLVICISTVLHLNVPPYGTSWRQLMWTKTRWILCGLIAPEIVVLTALDQWLIARGQRELVNEYLKSNNILKPRKGKSRRIDEETIELDNSPEGSLNRTRTTIEDPQSKIDKWTLTEGFFLVMGGVAFDTTEVSSEHQRLVVTPDGVELLIKFGYLPMVSHVSIEDKSKADFLAKGIVILQAGWLLLQCIARKIESLPISLLELHSMVHVVCAFFMYIFWFRKPLDVKDPMILDPNRFEEILSFMMMVSPGLGLLLGQETDRNEASMLFYNPKPSPPNEVTAKGKGKSRITPHELFGVRRELSMPSRQHDSDEQSSSSRYNPLSREIPREKMKEDRKTFLLHANEIDSSTGLGLRSKSIDLTLQDVTRWRLAARALERHPELKNYAKFSEDPERRIEGALVYDFENLSVGRKKFVVPHVTNLRDFTKLNERSMRDNWSSPFLLILFSAIYGAVHACAYNFVFPTTIEAALWYVSSLHIATGAYLVFIVMLDEKSDIMIYRQLRQVKSKWYGKRMYLGLLLVLKFLIPFCYIIARCFIVVEAFASLRKMPIRAYETVSWTNFLPHI